MKESCSSGFHYPLAPLLRLRPWGTREERRQFHSEETVLRLNVSVLSHRKLQREKELRFPKPLCGTHFSEGNLAPSAANTGHERQPVGTGNYHKPSGQCGPVGQVDPMRYLQPTHLLGHKGHEHVKHAAVHRSVLSCKLRLFYVLVTSSCAPLLVKPWGLLTDICSQKTEPPCVKQRKSCSPSPF